MCIVKKKKNQIYVLTEVFESVCCHELASSGWDFYSVWDPSTQRNFTSCREMAVFLPGIGVLSVRRGKSH